MKKITIFLFLILISLNCFSQWEKQFFVDDFNDSTNKFYYSLKNNVNGTFSNFFSNESNLSVNIIINANTYDIYLYLYMYDNHIVKGNNDKYILKIKDDIGNIYLFKCISTKYNLKIINNYHLFYSNKTIKKNLLNILINNSNLKFYMEKQSKDNYITYFNFQIKNTNQLFYLLIDDVNIKSKYLKYIIKTI